MAALKVILIVSLVAMVTSYPTGAPAGTCESMTPGHAASTGSDPSIFTVSASTTMYGPGDEITVTISTSGTAFRGFHIQARKAGETTPYGTFKTPSASTQLLQCSAAGDAWTHSDRTDKTSVTATWTAPDSDMGTIAFQATIVQEFSQAGGVSIFYQNIMSEDLVYNGPTGMTPTNAPGTTSGGGAAVMVRSSLLVIASVLFAMFLMSPRM